MSDFRSRLCDLQFQFTPLREGRPVGGFIFCTALLFQFTPLREGRPIRGRLAAMALYFNSRPSARGDEEAVEAAVVAVISIHAPPRGATSVSTLPSSSLIISIHAPPRGATQGGCTRNHLFQGISIHAPPRGATHSCAYRKFFKDFNSRPSARGDPPPPKIKGRVIFQFTPLREGRHERSTDCTPVKFQFTPLREGRQLDVRPHENELHFNSRPSARGDSIDASIQLLTLFISIHAPPRGATADCQRV